MCASLHMNGRGIMGGVCVCERARERERMFNRTEKECVRERGEWGARANTGVYVVLLSHPLIGTS